MGNSTAKVLTPKAQQLIDEFEIIDSSKSCRAWLKKLDQPTTELLQTRLKSELDIFKRSYHFMKNHKINFVIVILNTQTQRISHRTFVCNAY